MDKENNKDLDIEDRGIIGDLSDNKKEDKPKDIKIEKPLNTKLSINIFDIFKKYKRIYIIVLLVTFVSAIIILALNIFKIINNKNTPNTDQSKADQQKIDGLINVDKEQDNLVKRKIDGVGVEDGKENLYPYSVIIENSVDARPLSSINEANVVYEALAEGNITRLLCVYANDTKIEKIGPVRSARPYFLEIADEYSPLFVHFGGSPEALNNINKGSYNITSLNGIVYDQVYFFRDKLLKAPHNAYTSTDLINSYLAKIGNVESNGYYTSWIFNNDLKEYKGSLISRKIDVIYNKDNTLYNVIWKYNEETKDYTRYDRNENEYLDDKNNVVKTNNVIMQFVSTEVIDKELRKRMDLTEGGKAIMIRDGNYIEGFWRKNNILNRTKFFSYDKDGNEVEYELKPGKIWIHILPKENN